MAQPPASSPATPATLAPPRWRLPQEAGLLGVIILLMLLLTCAGGQIETRDGQLVNNFFRADNLIANVATPMSWIAIMAVGATAVIIAGGIDLSVGSVMAGSALATAAILQQFPADAPAWQTLPVAFAVALGCGALAGLLNGALVALLRIHPFIITLGTLYIFRGIALVAVPTKTLPTLDHQLPASFTDHFMAQRWYLTDTRFVQPMPMLLMLLTVVGGWVLLHHTIPGRQVFALGGNEEAARFAGIPVQRTKIGVYVLAGLTAGLAGLLSLGYHGSVSTSTASGYELTVIAAAVVGGASLSGGRGAAVGALLGALIIQLIENGIFILREVDLGVFTLKLSKEYARIINGVAIVLAVALDRFGQYLQQRRLQRQQIAQLHSPETHP